MKTLFFVLAMIPACVMAGVKDNRAATAQSGSNQVMMDCVADCNGNLVCPGDLDHAYAYSAGTLVSDTGTDKSAQHTWVKTYTYSGTQVATETCWAPQ